MRFSDDLNHVNPMCEQYKRSGIRQGFRSGRLPALLASFPAGITKSVAVCMLLLGPIAHAEDSSDTTAPTAKTPTDVLLIIGAPGTEDFGSLFSDWATTWHSTCDKAGLAHTTIGRSALDESQNDHGRLQQQLDQIAKQGLAAPTSKPLWIVLSGHGTWDGKRANFN